MLAVSTSNGIGQTYSSFILHSVFMPFFNSHLIGRTNTQRTRDSNLWPKEGFKSCLGCLTRNRNGFAILSSPFGNPHKSLPTNTPWKKRKVKQFPAVSETRSSDSVPGPHSDRSNSCESTTMLLISASPSIKHTEWRLHSLSTSMAGRNYTQHATQRSPPRSSRSLCPAQQCCCRSGTSTCIHTCARTPGGAGNTLCPHDPVEPVRR